MDPLLRPIIAFLGDPLEAPDPLIRPQHEPLRAAFVPYATGLLMNEMKSYLEWLAARGDFSWMNEDWEYVEDLFSYWPYLENSVGDIINPYYFAYDPTMVYALLKIVDDTFMVSGVVATNAPPDLDLADYIETHYPDSGITRMNISLVPLELVDVPRETIDSVVYFWANALSTMDWESPKHRIDAMVYWSSEVRDRFDSLLEKENPTPRNEDIYHPTQEDMLEIRGLFFKQPTYCDPLATSCFIADVRRQLPELPPEATARDLSFYYRTGKHLDSIGSDPGVYIQLNAILSKYPDDIQERLLTGIDTTLDPRDMNTIGAGYGHGRRLNREGEQVLTYEELLQPWS